ncbi:MAG: hypothetical protein ACOC9Q_01775, partial [bacterium]
STGELAHAFAGTTFMNTERLNLDLHDSLAALGFAPHDLGFVRGLGKKLPAGSRRDSSQGWRHYYSPELKQLVREQERMLLSTFPDFDA